MKSDDAMVLFARLAPAFATSDDAHRLRHFFARLHYLDVPITTETTTELSPDAPPLKPDAPALKTFFDRISTPIARQEARGETINPWQVAGLKRNEVRTAATLASLWRMQVGGTMSRDFLAAYLTSAIPDIAWQTELQLGYAVLTEVNPLGEVVDRVDIIVETYAHLIGIEVKIDAALGLQQLERYASVLLKRAKGVQRTSHLVLLAPIPSHMASVPSTTWRDVATAARSVAGGDPFAQSLIHRFGDHVAHL